MASGGLGQYYSGPYTHVASRDNLEMTETGRPAGASAPTNDWQDNGGMEQYRNYDGRAGSDSNNYLSMAGAPPKSKKSKLVKIIIGAVVGILVIVGVVLALVFTVGRKNASDDSSSGGSTSGGGGGKSTTGNGGLGDDKIDSRFTGQDGSQITMEDGTTFTYVNEFGGDWVDDPSKPFGPGGKAQSWSPRVGTEEWKWGEYSIRGVNLGGWLVTEPFIVPALYEKYMDNAAGIEVESEWTLSQAMGADLATEMENHYRTFITEKDFAEIAAAGLNWIRVPIGFWAIETMNDEPFLPKVSWTYFLKAQVVHPLVLMLPLTTFYSVKWARKYGLRIFLDLHAIPGSQNGWNHSGKSGSVNFMHGVMGIANAQRTLSYLQTFTEFISQPEYKDVVQMLGIVNEILWATIGKDATESFYSGAYEAIRKVSGIGAGNGPYIAIHEGFQGVFPWEGFLAGSDRVVLDQHPYLAFQGTLDPTPEPSIPKPCEWAIATNRSQSRFGVTVGGEFSTAVNNCGLWLNGIGSENPPACSVWNDWSSWDQSRIDGLKQVTLGTMDALQSFFFWTWRIGDSTVLGTSSCPMWHYRLGLERGWVPKDPREAVGHCARVLGNSQPFDGQFPATATGGAGAGTLAAAGSRAFPPASMSPSFDAAAMALLPTYTPTGTPIKLPGPSVTSTPSDNGASNAEPAYVPVAGCSYPNAWDATAAPLPTARCTGA